MNSDDLAERLRPLLDGLAVTSSVVVGHGHAWTLYRARLDNGSDVFVKSAAGQSDSTTTRALRAEAAGLRWLRAVDDQELIAPVLGADDRTLILPWLAETAPSPAAAETFGRALARLHSHTTDCFGAPWGGYIATLPQDNSMFAGEWGQWYARHRLAPLLPAAATILGGNGIRVFDRVLAEIDQLAGPSELPSRIHGDLWAGNLCWTDRGVVLIDPAAHSGHRETDLAMLRLFGAPHLDRILAAYREQFPLAPGFERRVPLHQLYPLLVHVVLFGRGYRGRAIAAAEAALAQ